LEYSPIQQEGVLSYFHQIHYVTMDDKGRIFMPAAFRHDAPPEILAGNFHMSPEKGGYLTARPKVEWEAYLKFIKRTKISAAKKNKYLKYLNALSQKTNLDRQNRLVLTPQLRKAMGLEADHGKVNLALLGAGEYFEIYIAENFVGEDAMLEEASLLREEIESVIDDFPEE